MLGLYLLNSSLDESLILYRLKSLISKLNLIGRDISMHFSTVTDGYMKCFHNFSFHEIDMY